MSPLYTQLLNEEHKRHCATLTRLAKCREHIDALNDLRPHLRAGGVDVEVTGVGLTKHQVNGRHYLHVRRWLPENDYTTKRDTADLPLLNRLLELGAVVDEAHCITNILSVCLTIGSLGLRIHGLPHEAMRLFQAPYAVPQSSTAPATTEAAA